MTYRRWSVIFPERRLFCVTHAVVTRALDLRVERHDYAEVFWVRRGRGCHEINGRRVPLHRGDVCLLRPERDVHALRALPGPPLDLTNLAFPRAILDDLKARYFTSWSFWGGSAALPYHGCLNEGERQWADSAIEELLRQAPSRLLLDRFLLNFLYLLHACRPDPYRACPEWLRQACRTLRLPEHFRQGVPALARLTRRSPPYVARLLKRLAGITPRAAVHAARMEYAAAQLVNTTREIKDIAGDCGYRSLSHFYSLFRKTCGATPSAYRRRRGTGDPRA